ncbi:hypothetical protein N4T77_11485 [Clostridium sp. CX1]|uniref:Uncharacterized protein n=1 Tax=Clostridium tanneri TaxID=3037988 RepID=A0ABU4JPA2_9CLOT|nr:MULTISPECIES: hypothetical protein [unclassified Clostridium]MCT8977225.1 hypothetical protein [Clostridium sp. CX1]MDW8799970.1 hypothetical protein [Clostridium sp. A1-XYC3]
MKNNILFTITIIFLLISVIIILIGGYENNYLLMIIGNLLGVVTGILNCIRRLKKWNEDK